MHALPVAWWRSQSPLQTPDLILDLLGQGQTLMVRLSGAHHDFELHIILDGHSAPSVAERLGLSGPNALYRWKRETLRRAGPAALTLGERVHQLEEELRRVER